MPAYTTPHGFPYPVSTDKIAATDDNLRLALKALADKSNQKHTESMSVYEDLMGTNPIRVRGTLPVDASLDALTARSDNGIWSMGGYRDGAPIELTVGAKVTVVNSQNDRYMRVDYRAGGGSYERYGTSSWSSWSRIDGPFVYAGAPSAEITALSQMNARRHNGIYRITESRGYTDLPDLPPGWNGGHLVNFSDGISSTLQFLTINFQAPDRDTVFWRAQTGPSGFFTPWVPLSGEGGGEPAPGGDLAALEARVALLEAADGAPRTTFENTKVFTTYAEGEAYMDRLARVFPEKVEILELGHSRQGLPIRAFQLGNPSKPAFYVLAAQHGSEPMGREAAYVWVRELCEDTSPETLAFLSNYCVVVTPTVNADCINVQRLNSAGTDLNTNWPTEGTAEITAASSVLKTHDVVITMDAHEGGKWKVMQAEVPTAPEVHQALKDASNGLFAAVETAFAEASEAFERYPGGPGLTVARNVIPERYKSAAILFEGTSDLDANMYSPDVTYRLGVYMLTYRSVFEYVRGNMSSFVAAKAAAL